MSSRQYVPRTAVPAQAHQPARAAVRPGAAATPHGIAVRGQGLPPSMLSTLGQALGHDLSRVRIHPNSSEATSLEARAFARGSEIHFAPGEYRPESHAGRFVIGHEVTHVVQQSRGRVRKPRADENPVVENPHFEAEADRVGSRFAARSGSHEGRDAVAAVGRGAPAGGATAGVGSPVQAMFRRSVQTGYRASSVGIGRLFSSGSGGRKPPNRPPTNTKSSHEQDTTESENAKKLAAILFAKQAKIAARNERLKAMAARTAIKPSARFLDNDYKNSFKSQLAQKSGDEAANQLTQEMKASPSLMKHWQKGHETGQLQAKSPFTSVATNWMSAALTTDPWLAQLIMGKHAVKAMGMNPVKGSDGVPQSHVDRGVPHLALLQTPSDSLRTPDSQLSQSETEHLFVGNNLEDHAAQVIPNPLRDGIPRFGRLPPRALDALAPAAPLAEVPARLRRGMRTGGGVNAPGRGDQYRSLLEGMRERLATGKRKKKKKNGQ